MLIGKLFTFIQKHPVFTFLGNVLINIILFLFIFDDKYFENMSSIVLSNIGLIVTVDTLISAFIDVDEWKSKENFTYLKEQNAFLIFKFLGMVVLFISIYVSPLDFLKSRNVASITYYVISFSILVTSVFTSFSQFFSRLLLNRFTKN